MRDLFLCELLRFRNAALIYAGVHLAVLVFLMRITDLLQKSWTTHLIVLVAYLVSGLVFAMVQFGTYRQPSRWLWLLHRPLARHTIFSAISLASACMIVFAVGLPALLVVAFGDYATGRTVDARHYLLVLYAVLLTATAWLTGSYVMLNGRRTAVVLLVLPLLVLVNLASAYVLLAPAIVCLLLLAWVAYGAFKPDRQAGPRGLAMIATALPLQIGFYLAMVAGFALAYQSAATLLGYNPLMMAAPPAGGYTEATRAEGRALFLRGLAGATDPRAAQWRRQIALLDIANFEPEVYEFPVRHQASNTQPPHFLDPDRGIDWTFSHDTMVFEGHDLVTSQVREPIGLKGIGDRTPFPEVPVLPPGPNFLMPHAVYTYRSEAGTVHPLIRVTAPETLSRQPREVGELLYVITNQRLVAYVKPQQGAAPALLQERFSVQLPEAFSVLDRVDIASLLDGHLVSFTFGRGMWKGTGESSQSIMLIDGAGHSRLIAQRKLTHDFPAIFEHHNWWISPALHALLSLPEALLDRGMILDKGKLAYTNELDETRPLQAWLAALAAAALSGLCAAWWLLRAPAGAALKMGWIASCVLLGPPALACMMVLQARRHKTAPPPIVQPALTPAT